MHMGCLNGSVLKEVVIYRSKQLQVRTKRIAKPQQQEPKEELESELVG
jgi:hypothetical protein